MNGANVQNYAHRIAADIWLNRCMKREGVDRLMNFIKPMQGNQASPLQEIYFEILGLFSKHA